MMYSTGFKNRIEFTLKGMAFLLFLPLHSFF